ncbi:MAG: hypothetical protein J5999_07925 [Oscillospiraceae bacterium]|nr:hypothetical protein [Oscillospiraceae bacterium]
MKQNTLENIIGSISGWTKSGKQKYTNKTENAEINYSSFTISGVLKNTKVKELTQEEINDTDRRLFYFVYDGDTENPIEKALSGDNSMDLIIAAERFRCKAGVNPNPKITLTVTNMEDILKDYVKNGVKNFHRIKMIGKNIE